MSLAPFGKLPVKRAKNTTCRAGREARLAGVLKRNKRPTESVAVRDGVFSKKLATKSSRVQKRRAQDVVGQFREFRTRNNPQLFQEKSMFPLDKDGKQPMMWQKVVRSGWQ